MLSLQEATQKTAVREQLRNVERCMDSYGLFHPSIASVLNVEPYSLRLELEEMIHTIPLREFLAKSGTTGISGAAYLVPDAMHNHLMTAIKHTDKVPLFSAEVVNDWVGGDLLVNIAVRQQEMSGANLKRKWTLKPIKFSSGGRMPTQTGETVQATVAPVPFSVAPRITEDLLEDANYDLMEWHLNHAAHQLGHYATDLAIADLKAAADGDGTQCVVAAGAGTTTASNILDAVAEIGAEWWDADTMIITHEAWADGVSDSTNASPNTSIIFPASPETTYDLKFHMLDTVFCNSSNLMGTVTSGRFTLVVTLVLDRTAALLCGRKRWLQMENYSKPAEDLAGMVISCRQDCVTLYKDASCELTET